MADRDVAKNDYFRSPTPHLREVSLSVEKSGQLIFLKLIATTTSVMIAAAATKAANVHRDSEQHGSRQRPQTPPRAEK